MIPTSERRVPRENSLAIRIAIDVYDNFIRNRSFRISNELMRRKAIITIGDIVNKHIVTNMIDSVVKE